MNDWRFVVKVALIAVFLTGFARCQLTGTCASIGYSTACCPRGGDCQATDGNCMCNAVCHAHGDCCQDVHCPANPRTCTDIGYTSCCSGAGVCDVSLSATTHCSCNVSCHLRGDCCPDIEAIGCVPQTCSEAGKSPGQCTFSSTSSCYVPGGKCYCDSTCAFYDDCCSDVPVDSGARPRCITELPTLPLHARIVNRTIPTDLTLSNITLYFQCEQGYAPTELLTAVCLRNDTWSPNPEDYTCSDINECLDTGICPPDSQCINTDGSYTCSCEEGYFLVSGENLNTCIDVDECLFGTHTCDDSERAECINNEGSYACVCKPGFVGNGESCQIIDGNTCSEVCDQFCIQQLEGSSIKCACDRGYYLQSDGVTCLDINECLTTYYDCIHAQCVNTNGSFLCVCEPDFTSKGDNLCEDIDECSTGDHNCNENAVCTNTVGSFDCTCQQSYFGDGITCLRGIGPRINRRDIRVKPNTELLYNIGTDFCLEDSSTGINLTITCLLTQDPQPPPEFQWMVALNNTNLNPEVDMYRHGLSVHQNNNTLSLKLNGTFMIGLNNNSVTLDIICAVENIYDNDTESTSISLCGPTECQDGVTNNCTQECTRNIATGVHECSCIPGYAFKIGSNSICEDIDECTRNTHTCGLVSRQVCHNTLGSFLCVCGPGYTGNNCSEDINECDFDTLCPESSMCYNLNGSFECVCVNGTKMDLTGNCTDIDECLEGDHNCSQHAVCINVDGSYTCECAIGYEGNGVNCTLSRSIIIGTSVAGSFIAAVILLLVTIAGSIKLLKCVKKAVKRQQDDREMDIITNEAREPIPGSKNVELRESMKEKLPPSFIIKSANLRLLDPIGQGFIDDSAVQELLRECDKMKNFHHLRVMTLKGVCLDGGQVPFIILPYMANGSLISYIRKERCNLVLPEDANIDCGEVLSQVQFIKKHLLEMCLQVAKGMEYLASKKLVHRDLAARNCMIDTNMVIKVADFGLAMNTGDKDYYRLSTNMGTKLPVRWMAPESLSDCLFSEMSDVWSYGVTCWEIFTGEQAPYAGTKPSSLLSLLQEGVRLEIPKNSACSTDVYSMMMWCWEMEEGKRPSFSALVQTLSTSLEEMAGYLHVTAFTDLGSSTDGQTEEDVHAANQLNSMDLHS